MTKNETEQKPFVPNLIVFLIEVLILLVYFAIVKEAIGSIMEGNISGAFNDVKAAIWFLNISALALTCAIFLIKYLRTKRNKRIAWFNLIWIAWNIYTLTA